MQVMGSQATHVGDAKGVLSSPCMAHGSADSARPLLYVLDVRIKLGFTDHTDILASKHIAPRIVNTTESIETRFPCNLSSMIKSGEDIKWNSV